MSFKVWFNEAIDPKKSNLLTMSFKVRFNEAIDPKKSPPSNLPAAGILGPDLVQIPFMLIFHGGHIVQLKIASRPVWSLYLN